MNTDGHGRRGRIDIFGLNVRHEKKKFSWRISYYVLFILWVFVTGGAWAQEAPLGAEQARPPQAPAPERIGDQDCLKCHDESRLISMRPEGLAAMVRIPAGEKPVLRNPEEIHKLQISKDKLAQSVHAGLSCTTCHKGITRLPHDQRLPRLACSDCHSEVESEIAAGPHKPNPTGSARPSCSDCHGSAHEIGPVGVKRTWQQASAMVAACERCHDHRPGSAVKTYETNVHGDALVNKGLTHSATCADCHGAHAMRPPSDPQSPLHPLNVPKTCGQCHQGIADIYATSIHGQMLQAGKTGPGGQPPATCTNCHHSHGIGPVDRPFMLSVIEECSHCHSKYGETYLKSYHGKATALGDGSAAVCSGCHGAHDILPVADPRSRVNKANLIQTCGSEKCHTGVNENFVKYLPHVNYTDPKSSMPVFVVWLVMNVLLLGTLAVFIPHGLLWFQRTLVERLRNPRGYHLMPEHDRRIRRFSMIHRITHGLIVISFMGLVATGFPIKYSYTEWGKTLAGMFGGVEIARMLHRGLALVTFAYAGVHAAFLIWFFWKKCPRPIWRYLIGPDSLIFSMKDLKDAWAMARWFFWLGPRPKFDRWTYFEKFDYFGEIWGVFVIGGTGLILWLPTLFTRWLPGWVLNCAMVIHSIEALLAASVIFLVHFFNTHLRPEKFPIDMVMLTGQMSEEEMKEERPAEYERLVETNVIEERVEAPVAFKWRLIGAILGMTAFLLGIVLIVLALKTELRQIFHW